MRIPRVIILVLVLLLPVCAQTIGTQLVAGGLQLPTFVCSPPGDYSRLLILEQFSQRILLIRDGVMQATPFLTIPQAVTSGGERGLLGLAFHPNYSVNRQFFVHYNDAAGDAVVARFQRNAANPDLADPTGTVIFTATQQGQYHKGGMIAFGPDGNLWMGIGDNGPSSNGQNLTTPLGKLLRMNVDVPASATQLWSAPAGNPYAGAIAGHDAVMHFGLRNPWRWSFDRVTGDLWIGDVGGAQVEEVDFIANGTAGGLNLGWYCWEGTAPYVTGGCVTYASTHPPLYSYAHGTQGTCVIGGFVYRGNAIPGLQGSYFFGDFATGRIWSLRKNGSGSTGYTAFTDHTAALDPPGTAAISFISSFGEDAAGELYVLDRADGELYKIVPVPATQAATLAITAPPALGTSIPFMLNSASDPNRAYLLAWSATNIPGTPLPDGRFLPLNLDTIFWMSLSPAWSSVFTNHAGLLSASGGATASLNIPALPTLIGMPLHGVFAVLDPQAALGIEQISNPLTVVLQ